MFLINLTVEFQNSGIVTFKSTSWRIQICFKKLYPVTRLVGRVGMIWV